MYKQNIFIAVFLSVLLIAGCNPTPIREWPAMEGQVLDAKNGAPIKGAIVVAFWEGYGAHGTDLCFHTKSTITGANGRYTIPAWINTGRTAAITYQEAEIGSIHKKHYRLVHIDSQNEDGTYLLEIDPSSSSERIEYLLKAANACFAIRDGSEDNAWPLLKEIYLEAVELAETKEDKKNIRWIVQTIYGLSNESVIYMNYEDSVRYANSEIERRKK